MVVLLTVTIKAVKVMRQLLLPSFPDGAHTINSHVKILDNGKEYIYFVYEDNYFSHKKNDNQAFRFAVASLISNKHVRPIEFTNSIFAVPHRTLMNWCRQMRDHGHSSFFREQRRRGATVLTSSKLAECSALLGEGLSIAEVGRRADVGASALSKALGDGRLTRPIVPDAVVGSLDACATNKSTRSKTDASFAEGMGTACQRADERIFAAIGLIQSAKTRFEPALDVTYGGLLVGLPSLILNGLFRGLNKYFTLPDGFYTIQHVLLLLGFMALARIRRPEGLRHVPPGELGKTIGLDRIPEVRTVRKKIAILAEQGNPEGWLKHLSKQWMLEEPAVAHYLYVDGHVRVYNGSGALLPRRYVSRERLCLRGTTDYWVNDALGRPFFVVSQTVTSGLGAVILDKIVPDLLANVPQQPTEKELLDDPLLHRFTVIFDREGSYGNLLAKLWQNRIVAITYRKAVKDKWPDGEFADHEVSLPDGETTHMLLASRQTQLASASGPVAVLEVRKLAESGHQTAIITTAQRLDITLVASRMFARWCQENFFAYMLQHFDIDGLVQYGSEDILGTTLVVNPKWRSLDKDINQLQTKKRLLHAKIGAKALQSETASVLEHSTLHEDLQQLDAEIATMKQQRRLTPKKIQIDSLPEDERPRQLLPLGKLFTDTVKMIAYRAETATVGILKKHLAKEDDARALAREIFVSSADILPDEKANTLTIRLHRTATAARDRAVEALLAELNESDFMHPETGLRMRYQLV